MKINKLKILSFASLTILFLFFVTKTYSFTDGFNVTIDEELITVAGKPGKSYPVTLHLETASLNLTVYPISLNLPSESSYSAQNTWLTPSQTSYNLNSANQTTITFTLTIPSDTSPGEYYKAIGVSDIVFTETESTNPPVLVVVPLTVQVSESAEESTTNTGSSSSSGSSSSTSSSSSTNSPSSASPVSNTTPAKITKKQIPIKETNDKNNLYSKTIVNSLKTKYSPLRQSTAITLSLMNEGNIYSIPTGTVKIINRQNNAIKTFPLNKNQNILKPNQAIKLDYLIDSPNHLAGFFAIEVYLGEKNSQQETAPELKLTKNFFHLGAYPTALIFFGLLVSILINRKHKNIKRIAFISSFLPLIYFFYQSHRPENYQYLGETKTIEISAEVKEQIGIKAIINEDLSKTIMFTSTNPLGSSLYTLQNNTRVSLDDISQHTFGAYTTNLAYPNDSFPLMMTTTGH